MFRPWIYFLPRKKKCILVSTLFYLWGVFGVFYAIITVFMVGVLVLSIKFSFHSISGFIPYIDGWYAFIVLFISLGWRWLHG